MTFDPSSQVVSGQGGRCRIKETPRLLTDVTIAAKPVVTPLYTVVNGPAVAIYPTWRSLHMLLAAPLKLWETRPVQLVVNTVLLGLYSLRFISVVAGIVWVVNGAARRWPD